MGEGGGERMHWMAFAWKGENEKKKKNNRCKRNGYLYYSNITNFGNIERIMYDINCPSGMNYNGVSLRQRK